MTYRVSVEEAALRLGLHPRSARRLIERSVLKGKLETTENGKAWFLNADEVESLVKSYESRRENQARLRAASALSGHDLGQPRASEDDRGQSEDDRRVLILENELRRERELHEKTQTQLKEEQTARLDAEKGKAQLEGEKMGFQRMVEQQERVIALMQDTILRLEAPKDAPRSASEPMRDVADADVEEDHEDAETQAQKGSDTAGADRGQPGTTPDMTGDALGQPETAAA